MAEPKKPFYRDKKWKLGGSFGQKAEKCPMCGKPLEWDGAENG